MNKLTAAIAYFEDAIRESDEIIAECSPELQEQLTEQKQHFVIALEAMRRVMDTACIHDTGDHCTVLSDAAVKQPCIEGPCPDHATLAEQQANLANKTKQLREAMELLGEAMENMKHIGYCNFCQYALAMSDVRIRCRQCDGQSGWRWHHAARYEALKVGIETEG